MLHSCVSHVLHLPVLDKEKEQSVQTIITATNSLLCIHQFFEKDLTVKLSKSFSLLWPLTFCFHIVRKVCSPESQFLKTEQGECEVIGWPGLPSLVLENTGKGSSADSCSELEGGNNDRDWLLLLLISLLKTGDWLLPVLWMGLGVQSSTGCFFWTSVVKDREWGSRQEC